MAYLCPDLHLEKHMFLNVHRILAMLLNRLIIWWL